MTSAASSSLPSGSVLSSWISGAAPLRAPLSNASALLALAFATRVGADPGETTRYYYEPQPVAQPQASTGGAGGIDNTALGVLVTVPALIGIAAVAWCAYKKICCFSRPPSNAQTQLANLPVGQPVASHLPVMAPPPRVVHSNPSPTAHQLPPHQPLPPAEVKQDGGFYPQFPASSGYGQVPDPGHNFGAGPSQPPMPMPGPSAPAQGGGAIQRLIGEGKDAVNKAKQLTQEQWDKLTPEQQAKARKAGWVVGAVGAVGAAVAIGGVFFEGLAGLAGGSDAGVGSVGGANMDELLHKANLHASGLGNQTEEDGTAGFYAGAFGNN